jgi:uncharacterized protein
MPLLDHLIAPGPKRSLALDGGGIRGVVTLGFLARIEAILRERHGRPGLVLGDYFDLIGGTSTGSIIAAGLAIGMSVDELRELYLAAGGEAFGTKLPFYSRLRATYDKAPLERLLKAKLGDRTMGDPDVRTGLCVVAKRADTNSTWPMHNHPRGRYHEANRRIPLWRAVRASTAAPTYFEPELMEVPDRQGRPQRVAFVDGGVSMACNPALQLFLLATLHAFAFRWETGADKLLLVSAGTGVWERRDDAGEVAAGKLWDWASAVPGMFMDDSSWQAQLMLQWWSSSPTPWLIDREVGDLRGDVLGRRELLSYLRYDVRIEPECLRLMGLADLAERAEKLRELDQAELRDAFDRIGRSAAARTVLDPTGREIQYGVLASHFPAGFDLPA